jgi:hypothetical protein
MLFSAGRRPQGSHQPNVLGGRAALAAGLGELRAIANGLIASHHAGFDALTRHGRLFEMQFFDL